MLVSTLGQHPERRQVVGLEAVPLGGLGGEDGDEGPAVVLEPGCVGHRAVQDKL